MSPRQGGLAFGQGGAPPSPPAGYVPAGTLSHKGIARRALPASG